MRYMHRYLMFFCILPFILSGCNGNSGKEMRTHEEGKPSGEISSTQTGEGPVRFPDSYTGGTSKIKIDCTLEVPEEFDPSDFYLPRVNGVQCINQDAAYNRYVKGREIREKYEYPKEEGQLADQSHYILSDGTVVSITEGFSYWEEDASYYSRVEPMTEQGASEETFSFKTADSCIGEVKTMLEELSYPLDDFHFSWFSVNKEECKALEEKHVASTLIEPEDVKEEWTDQDNFYEIYAWQMYGGLYVFPQDMSVQVEAAGDAYYHAPLTVIYTGQGILSLNAEPPYILEQTEEKVTFLPFPEIAGTVADKYENMLDDEVYEVKRAKLAVRICLDEQQQYAAQPIWYFEVADDSGKTDVVHVDAVSGKELPMNSSGHGIQTED